MLLAITFLVFVFNGLALADEIFDENFIDFPDENFIDFPDTPGGMRRSPSTYDVFKRIKFTLYTRNGPTDGLILDKNPNLFSATTFKKNKAVKIVTHGFHANGGQDQCVETKDAYLKHQDVNVVILDWKDLAAQNYLQSSRATKDVGQSYGQYIDFLVEQVGVSPSDIHLIGHSLGAHVSGFAGNASKYDVGRISGLDPAYPSFGLIQVVGSRLSEKNAQFVDIIHTSRIGLQDPIGHVDFYPNDGEHQPGCQAGDVVTEIGCNHGRSWKYFVESINPSSKFLATQCKNAEEAKKTNCSTTPVPMGEYVPLSVRGKYYLKTNKEAPFATNQKFLKKS